MTKIKNTAKKTARIIIGFVRDCVRDGARIFWQFFMLAFPIVVVVRVLDLWFDFTARAGAVLSPLMALVGLPGDAGVVWATAILVNVYSGLILTAELWDVLALSGAQATVLSVIMLIAHSLPVEVRIAQKAGVRAPITLIARLGGAIVLGALLSAIYQYGGWLQDPAVLLLRSPSVAVLDWGAWLWQQGQNWLLIFAALTVLLALIRIMKITRAERLLFWLLSPLLRQTGIGERATTLTMIGMTLGLSYGGALLIGEAKNGNIPGRDILCAFLLLGLCHSLIEDTPVMALIGGDISGVLAARIIFAVIIMALFARFIAKISDANLHRYFLIPNPSRPLRHSPK
ncbi:MAG: hypothetical protein ACR2P4_10700 [Gammaproteobacteria bacterium]